MSNGFTRPVDVCLVVNNLFESVKSNSIHYPISVESGWLPSVSKKLSIGGDQYAINVKCVEWTAKQLSGFLLRYNDHADIYYSHTLNQCWSRWVICKELAHLLIDTEPKHYTKDPVSLVQHIINQLPEVAFDHDVNSEFLAAFAAIEMLLPWEMRPIMERMMKEGQTDLQIAKEFLAPERYVNLVLRNPQFVRLSAEANAAH